MAKQTSGEAFHFKIAGFTPESLPMARLAEYMTDLASLLGNQPSVHFVKVAKGSADLVHVIDEEQETEVKARLFQVKQGIGSLDAQAAFRNLNIKLAEDRTTARMTKGRGQLLKFPGISDTPPTYGPITVQGHLDGKIIRVGGKDGTKPVHLQSVDAYYICNANAEIAKRLARAYEQDVRVHGTGRWVRQADGRWNLLHFNIAEFELLDDTSLSDFVERLQATPGNGWKEVKDPLSELASIRSGEVMH